MRIVALAVALILPAAASAERAVLLRGSGLNVHEGHLAAATEVFRSQLERTGRFQVTIVAAPGGVADEPTAAQAGEAARAAGADFAITLRMARLGSNAFVRIAVHRPDGSLAHVDELAAASPNDLERVLQRLAEGAAAGRPARDLASIETVTEREADAHLKYVTTHVFGVRLGGHYVGNRVDRLDRSSTPAGGGVFWLYDARKYLADFTVDVFGGDEDRIFAVGIGTYYPFSRGNESPYLGCGLAWAAVEHGGDGATGLMARFGGGMLFGRLSTLQIRVDGGYAVNLFEETNDLTGESRAANGPYLTLGIGF